MNFFSRSCLEEQWISKQRQKLNKIMKGHIMKRIPILRTFDRLTYNDRNRSDDYDLYPDLDELMAVIDQDIKEETVREETRKALKTKICPECGGKLVKKWYSKKISKKRYGREYATVSYYGCENGPERGYPKDGQCCYTIF